MARYFEVSSRCEGSAAATRQLRRNAGPLRRLVVLNGSFRGHLFIIPPRPETSRTGTVQHLRPTAAMHTDGRRSGDPVPAEPGRYAAGPRARSLCSREACPEGTSAS